MNRQNISLIDLPANKMAKITSVGGGVGLQRKLRTLGVREGQEVKISSRQPFRGPLTIKVCGSQITLGRGIARRILVEEL
ncbi:MAG: ferrous iron transport protein A [Thermoplasmatales archaeon]|nr:ferrous iron transport protein A [Thermoplasmatales archaeon]